MNQRECESLLKKLGMNEDLSRKSFKKNICSPGEVEFISNNDSRGYVFTNHPQIAETNKIAYHLKGKIITSFFSSGHDNLYGFSWRNA